MKTKAIILAISLVTLAIFAQGWRSGQQSNNGNPTAQNCANTGCHGGTLPGASVLLTMISGNNQTWTPGNNAVIIQPIAATDTAGGGFSGDSTLKCWGYTMNFTSCTGQPIPISVSMHNCSGGMPLRYQSNGIWYVESTQNPVLQWQQIPGQPANVSYLTNYCIATFTINAATYADSLKMNLGIVFSNCDSTERGDSTVFYSSKLGYTAPLDHEVQEGDILAPFHEHPIIVETTVDGLRVHAKGRWTIINTLGVVVASGDGNSGLLKLATGMYYLMMTDTGKTKAILIR